MNDITATRNSAATATVSRPSPFRSLLLQEFNLHRGSITTLAVVWFIGLWILVIFYHPAWFVAIGLIHVMTVSASQGGRDVIDGTEEFSFTLPPGRGLLFLARLTPGVVFLTLSGLLGGAAVALDLPQRVWSIVFSGGLTDPFAAVENRSWYALALLVPLAAHSLTFTTAALATTRSGVGLAWLAGIGGAGGIALAASAAENAWFGGGNGLLAGAGLFAMAALVPLAGYRAYFRKEVAGGSGEASSARRWMIVLLILAVLLAMVFVSYLRVSVSQPETRPQPARSSSSVPADD